MVRPLDSRWWMVVLWLCACGDDSGGDADSGGDSGSGSSTVSTSATVTSTSADDGSSSNSTSGSGSESDSGSDGESDGDSGSDSATTGGVVTCGELDCADGELCVSPCCGGPAPFCGPARGDVCPQGQHPVDSCQFGPGCDGPLCCEDDPCVPEPPFCTAPDATTCMEDPNSQAVHCSDPCFGDLVDGTILCQCA